MKKIFLLLLLLPLMLASCLKDDDDVFSGSANDRLTEAIEANKAILQGAKNGWSISYYPNKEQIYGGYAVLAKFEGSNVTMAGEYLFAADDTSTSLWDVKPLGTGGVLSFDTYNEIFHFFSEPNSGIGPVDVGMGGDFDFYILEASATLIKLQGTKTGNKMYMTPIEDGVNWETLLNTHNDITEELTCRLFNYHINGKVYQTSISNRTLLITHVAEDGEILFERVPFIITLDKTYKFYEPFTFDGVEVSEMKYVDGASPYFEDVDGSGAKLMPVLLSPSELLVSLKWYFSMYNNMGSAGKTQWNLTNTEGLQSIGEELVDAYFTTVGGAFGFGFRSTPNGSSVFSGTMSYDYTAKGDNKVELKFTGRGTGDGMWYYDKAKFSYIVNQIAGKAGKTYTLSIDNIKNPSWLKMVDDADPNNTYVLTLASKMWPFD